MSNVAIFNFESKAIRSVLIEGEPWFVAADVCSVLEIANSRDALSRLDIDEKAGVGITDTSSNGVVQERNTSVINESGLYSLVLTSRKPEAEAFKKWLTSEVLPSIRKTGLYAAIKINNRGLIQAVGSDLWAETHSVAAIFGRRHSDVVEAFRQALGELDDLEESWEGPHNDPMCGNFRTSKVSRPKMEEVSYTDARNRQQVSYRVNRPLFNYTVLNFTGQAANRYRYWFIQQFEEVDQQCKLMLSKQAIYRHQNKQSLYVLKNELTGLVKIGVSADPVKRANDLSNQSGCPLQIVYTSPKCKNAFELEQVLHKSFSAYRQVGEWFQVPEHDVVDRMRGLSYDFGSGHVLP